MKNNFSFEQGGSNKQPSYDELLSACRQRLELEPNNPDIYLALGNLLRQHPNQLEEASQAYQKVINLTSSYNTLAYKGITKVIKRITEIATINQPPYQTIILHAAIGGLGNRLRALCSYLCLSYFWDIPLFLCWYPEEACNCYFQDLYEDVCETISPQSMLQLLSSENSAQTLYVKVGINAYESYLKDDVDHETFRNQYLRFVRKIKPKNHLIQEIEKFKQQNWTDNIVGLHIRRTDLYPHLKSRNLESEFSSDEQFVSKIESELSNGCSKLFLATDNQATQNFINQKFPGKIISYCQSFDNLKKRHTGVENALIDLYLLSKSSKIIGSYYSSFSGYAADLGNIPLIYP